MVRDATAELHSATDIAWRFVTEEPIRLPDTAARRQSQFLDEAMNRLVEGPYDIVIVATDVALLSRTCRFVPGLASPVSRVAVVSTHKLMAGPRDEPVRSLDTPAVRWNAATLLLHLLGHVLGAQHGSTDGGVMDPFEFDPSRRGTPDFDADAESYLHRIGQRIPEEESSRGRLARVGFHGLSALRNPEEVVSALRGSRAFAFPLSLPKLATTAITPTLVIVFSAESWDVALHLSNATAALFAVVSILAAAIHLMFVQNLFFPWRKHQIITEHMALVNVSVFAILVAAMVGSSRSSRR
jgi:predicted Zn-dependent protease